MASITAAYELTSSPELRERYDVTIHQSGWRLGGKCASGRNAAHGERIEEHGLHIWFGFYENAFRVMRDAYEQLGRRPGQPLATWRDAFKPCEQIVLYECFEERWRGWGFAPPPNLLTPGDSSYLPTFWEVAHTMLDYLFGRWEGLKATNPHAPGPPPVPLPFGIHLPFGVPFGIDRMASHAVARLVPWDLPSPERAIIDALAIAQQGKLLGPIGSDEHTHRSLLFDAIDEFKRWLWHYIVEPNLGDDDLRLFFTMFDTGTTILEGIVEDGLIERGFDGVNDEDLRAWLVRHGAHQITVDQGPFVRGLYDMAFAYTNGDVSTPDMAAGTAIHDLLRIFFTYREAFAWKMQAGMGDTVFTPFYEVLKKRGVRFEFFHHVSKLGLSPDRSTVDTIEVIPQVRLKGAEYDPLVEVKGLLSWPSEPRWDQIVEGEKLRGQGVNLEWDPNPLAHGAKTLRQGEDFDLVVLGISVAALPAICEELIADADNPGFRSMIDNSHTVMTQAFQLWLNRPLSELGWPFVDDSIMTTYVEPLDTYAEMSHLIPREAWPAGGEDVQNVAYFCGVLEDRPGDSQETANDRARAGAMAYLRRDAAGIWPKSIDRGGRGFDWNLLAGGGRGPSRFDSQYWLANFQPTERYVLTPAGSVRHRLGADQSGYENLFLAGDWVKTGLDAGCVEAAVMSGMQASRAICGVPQEIVGEDQTWLGGQREDRTPEAPAGLPPYVDYGGLATCPSPVDCDDATLYSFFLEGDHDRLATLCDRVFTQPSDGQLDLRPLGSLVMLSFGRVEKIKPQLEPWSRMGFARELQVAFWVPVVAIRSEGILPVAVSLGWFVPYMWVDNPLSLAGGREIYGFNKNLGGIKLPVDGGKLTLEAYGGDFGGGEPAGWHPLIEVTPPTPSPFGSSTSEWEDLDGLVDVVRRELRGGQSDLVSLPGLDLPDQVFADILGSSGPPQIFLKQFRSVAGGKRASQQQITDAGATVKRIRGGRLPGEFEFRQHHLDSHPIVEELGVQDQVTSLAFEVEMDFVLGDGRVLWEGRAG